MAAVLARRPAVCLVDGLAYDNPPAAAHPKRYQDVEELLDAGISVLTSINLEYIDEQQEFVERLIGRRSAETVPQAFIDRADEVVVVDAPPTAPLGERRLATRRPALGSLRERALLLAADVVERQLDDYLRAQSASTRRGARRSVSSSA